MIPYPFLGIGCPVVPEICLNFFIHSDSTRWCIYLKLLLCSLGYYEHTFNGDDTTLWNTEMDWILVLVNIRHSAVLDNGSFVSFKTRSIAAMPGSMFRFPAKCDVSRAGANVIDSGVTNRWMLNRDYFFIASVSEHVWQRSSLICLNIRLIMDI